MSHLWHKTAAVSYHQPPVGHSGVGMPVVVFATGSHSQCQLVFEAEEGGMA